MFCITYEISAMLLIFRNNQPQTPHPLTERENQEIMLRISYHLTALEAQEILDNYDLPASTIVTDVTSGHRSSRLVAFTRSGTVVLYIHEIVLRMVLFSEDTNLHPDCTDSLETIYISLDDTMLWCDCEQYTLQLLMCFCYFLPVAEHMHLPRHMHPRVLERFVQLRCSQQAALLLLINHLLESPGCTTMIVELRAECTRQLRPWATADGRPLYDWLDESPFTQPSPLNGCFTCATCLGCFPLSNYSTHRCIGENANDSDGDAATVPYDGDVSDGDGHLSDLSDLN